MKLIAEQIPWSSIVGTGVLLAEGEDGPCAIQINLVCHRPVPKETQLALAKLITKSVNSVDDL